MLSDPDSRVIREYGILNTYIPPADSFFYGIPFPGTFLIDESGVVIDKLFRPHLSTRDTGEAIIDRMLGRSAPGVDDPIAFFAEEDEIEITAFFRGGRGRMRIGPLSRLIVRFEMPQGIHIYKGPVPDGMTAVNIEVEAPDGVVWEAEKAPATEPLSFPGLDAPLEIWSEEVDFEFSIFGNSTLAPKFEESGEQKIDLSVLVRYQACDDDQCFLPRTRRLELSVPLAKSVIPDFEEMKRASASTVKMDSVKHWKVLSERQSARDSGQHD